jgi:hypothetical protein
MRDPTAQGTESTALSPLASRLDSLDGKRIGFYNNAKPAAEPVTDVIREMLADRYPNATFEQFHVPARDEAQLREIGEWAAVETDACLAIIGDCGGCTRAIVRATSAIENAGVPAVGLVAEAFGLSFETNAENQGRALRHQPVPIRSETTDRNEIQAGLDQAVLDGIEAALTEPRSGDELDGTED